MVDLDRTAAATVHYATDPRIRLLAQARWRMTTHGTETDWLWLGKNNPEALIAEAREWVRAAVAAGILPAPKPAAEDPTPGAAASPAPLVDEPRPFEELRDTGLLWLVNRLAFHPRGVALAVHTDDAGTAHGWSLLRSNGGPMAFDTATDAEGQARAETTLAAAADTPR